MWIGKKPSGDTPAGATYQYNRAIVLKDCRIRGIGVAEDTFNPGEFVVYLMLCNDKTGEEFTISTWADEEMNRPGWLDIIASRKSD
jgi:hypothetical protein